MFKATDSYQPPNTRAPALRACAFAALLCFLPVAASDAGNGLGIQAFSFDSSGLLNRFLTPNGDRKNDTVVFQFSNPMDSAVSGKIYDLRMAFVADLQPGPQPDTLQWDGKAGGAVVPSGLYLYHIEAEGRSFMGILVVIK